MKAFKDERANVIQVIRPGATELIVSTGSSSASAVQVTGVVRIVADAPVHIALNAVANATDVYIPADSVEYFAVAAGDTLNVIGTANVYITNAT